jgi:predicted ATPase
MSMRELCSGGFTMKRYVLTGAPGAGKTTVVAVLRRLGYATVAEAATEVIARRQAVGEAEPWAAAGFVDAVLAVQREWEAAVVAPDGICFFDRSPVCTLALSRFLGRVPTVALRAEIDRIRRAETYQRTVFFLANLGFVEATAARRISFEDSLVFGEVHREVYRELGFQLVDIGVGTPQERASWVLAAIRSDPADPSASPRSAGRAS